MKKSEPNFVGALRFSQPALKPLKYGLFGSSRSREHLKCGQDGPGVAVAHEEIGKCASDVDAKLQIALHPN